MTDGAGTSRIEHARRKSADAKRRLAVAAGVSFLAAALLAWVSHAGAQPASGASSGSSPGAGGEVQPTDDFDFGAGLLIPPGSSAPSTGTHVS